MDSPAFVKIGTRVAAAAAENAFSGRCGPAATALPAITNAGIRPELAGFVLNAPLSSAICR